MSTMEAHRRLAWSVEGEVVVDDSPTRYLTQAATAADHGLTCSPLYQIEENDGVLSLVEVAQARPRKRTELTAVPDEEEYPPVLQRTAPQTIPPVHLSRVQPGNYEYRYGTHSFAVVKDDDGVWTLTHDGPRPDRLDEPGAEVYEIGEVLAKFVKVREAREYLHAFLVDMSTYNGHNTKLAEVYKKRRLKGSMPNDDTVTEALAA